MSEIGASRRVPRMGKRGCAVLAACAATLAVASPGSVPADSPPWAAAPTQAAAAGAAQRPGDLQLTYRVPAGLRDGRCRPELFEEDAAGGLVGTAAAGFQGSQFGPPKDTLATTAIGILVGAAVGRGAGSAISRSEEVCFSQSFEHVADRETIAWMDPVEGVHYAVTPTRTVKGADGRYCREYTARATVNGQAAGIFGTACRQPDGRWELIN